MIAIEWTIPAFAQLESLNQSIAFEIIRRVDLLATFPAMGVVIEGQYPALQNLRQIIIKRTYRVIYEYDQRKTAVYILAVQHCRQQLPTPTELRLSRLLLPPEK